MSNVIAADLWPSIFRTALTLEPADTDRLAAVCRRSCYCIARDAGCRNRVKLTSVPGKTVRTFPTIRTLALTKASATVTDGTVDCSIQGTYGPTGASSSKLRGTSCLPVPRRFWRALPSLRRAAPMKRSRRMSALAVPHRMPCRASTLAASSGTGVPGTTAICTLQAFGLTGGLASMVFGTSSTYPPLVFKATPLWAIPVNRETTNRYLSPENAQ